MHNRELLRNTTHSRGIHRKYDHGGAPRRTCQARELHRKLAQPCIANAETPAPRSGTAGLQPTRSSAQRCAQHDPSRRSRNGSLPPFLRATHNTSTASERVVLGQNDTRATIVSKYLSWIQRVTRKARQSKSKQTANNREAKRTCGLRQPEKKYFFPDLLRG
jgi:hypothetical protein